MRAAGRRYHETTRTHAEAIHAPSIHLSDKAVLGGREILASAILVVILDLVNEVRGMLQAYTHGNALGFYLDTIII